jgi:flagellar hook-associated protein 2
MRTAVDDFVKAYNALNDYITDQMKYDPNTKVAGKLQGDSAVRSLQNQLRTLTQSASGASSALTRLSSAGIEIQRDGSLLVNTTKFNAALADPAVVAAAFSNDEAGEANDGFGVRFRSLTTTLTGTGGLLDSRSEGLRNQIKRQDDQIARLETRVASAEARLLRQYNALDSNIGKLNSLGSYVNQQVTAWNNTNNR